MNYFHALFETPIGRCAIAWSGNGIRALQLPDADDEATLEGLRKHAPGSTARKPSRVIQQAVAFVNDLLAGKGISTSLPRLDLAGQPPFHKEVYETLCSIPNGTTISYGELAAAVGRPRSARIIGRIVGSNPIPLLIPCHRVIGADGSLRGFSAPGGVETKKRILELEGTPMPRRPASTKISDSVSKSGFDTKAAERFLKKCDPVMRSLIERVGPCKLSVDRLSGLFEALLESIVYQQLTGKAAATIFGRVADLFKPKTKIEPLDLLRASDEELRGAGLSGSKVAAVRDLAEKTAAGELPTIQQLHLLEDEEIVGRLTLVRGIGRWTAEMLLIFRLGRPDILSTGDYGLRKGYAVLYNNGILPTPREFAAAGERWKPWRSIASWYLWRAAEGVRLPGEGRR
ncbi:MAG TPA: methylated-DNA--[protein]-cysteine S-methyltransferase [Candidatus Ozemobacteraceae bacterium]|nr:methylated-DNA--[protein]-cysteine S-methyltransferase [Candidatus Ozemobacteraceae bacterium]